MVLARSSYRTAGIAAVAAALAVVWAQPSSAQFHDPTREDSIYLDPGTSQKRARPPVKLSFTLLEEIPLPGPLVSRGPRLNRDRVEIPVASGWVSARWPAGPEAQVRRESGAEADDEPTPDWSVGPEGKFRFRSAPDNRIVAEKRCRHCPRGWRRVWKLRVAGQSPALPLVTDRRVFFGALDNRVYSVKKRNGHRVWATDVGGRVSGALVLWAGGPAPGEEEPRRGRPRPPLEAILVVPDRGTRILALDPLSGTEVASYSLTETGSKLVGAPLTLPDGKIVAATQKYAPEEASLVVLRLDPVAPSSDEAPPVLYNGESTASGPAPAR